MKAFLRAPTICEFVSKGDSLRTAARLSIDADVSLTSNVFLFFAANISCVAACWKTRVRSTTLPRRK